MSCALDDRALAEQLERFGRIGAHALWARRLPTELTVVLEADLDDNLLAETLAVERACCPFFALIWDESTRELTIAAREHHEDVFERVVDALAIEPAVA
jgi:hypothetical protein